MMKYKPTLKFQEVSTFIKLTMLLICQKTDACGLITSSENRRKSHC